MKINCHAGHNPDGKIACGAVGYIKESTEARKVKDEVISQLRDLGHMVYDCTCNNGTSKQDVLTKIVKLCNARIVDLDISIHFNAATKETMADGKTKGVEVYIYRESDITNQYAQRVCAEISRLGFQNRGVKVRPSLYVLQKTKAPAMLIECCFVDDKDDVQLYDAQKMADAIVRGIAGQNPKQVISDIDPDTEKQNAETPVGDGKTIYRVQVGAYSVKENAEKMAERLRQAGFDAIITK